jgi:hypothetical protein
MRKEMSYEARTGRQAGLQHLLQNLPGFKHHVRPASCQSCPTGVAVYMGITVKVSRLETYEGSMTRPLISKKTNCCHKEDIFVVLGYLEDSQMSL